MPKRTGLSSKRTGFSMQKTPIKAKKGSKRAIRRLQIPTGNTGLREYPKLGVGVIWEQISSPWCQ
jgi:hypothetical protein